MVLLLTKRLISIALYPCVRRMDLIKQGTCGYLNVTDFKEIILERKYLKIGRTERLHVFLLASHESRFYKPNILACVHVIFTCKVLSVVIAELSA